MTLKAARYAQDVVGDAPNRRDSVSIRFVKTLFVSLSLLLVSLVTAAPAFSAPLNITVVISNDSGAYVEIAESISNGANRAIAGKIQVIGVNALAQLDDTSADVIVAVGVKAAQAVASKDLRVPVLNTLVPRITFEKIARQRRTKSDNQFSAVYLDQPIARQLDLIRQVMPARKRVGVIVGPDSHGLLESLQAEVRARGLELNAVRINTETELFPALENVLSEVDVLLALPDSLVSTSHTIQSVLFTAYRHQVPVIGFSPAYVKAGALVAVHSTPAQLARQVNEILQRLSANPTLPAPQHPEYFSIAVNAHVARSLEIPVEGEEAVAAKLRGAKPKP